MEFQFTSNLGLTVCSLQPLTYSLNLKLLPNALSVHKKRRLIRQPQWELRFSWFFHFSLPFCLPICSLQMAKVESGLANALEILLEIGITVNVLFEARSAAIRRKAAKGSERQRKAAKGSERQRCWWLKMWCSYHCATARWACMPLKTQFTHVGEEKRNQASSFRGFPF